MTVLMSNNGEIIKIWYNLNVVLKVYNETGKCS